MRCYKKFCDEEKIRRQERSEEKRAKQITETVPITEDSSMEPIEEPSRKVTRSSQICSSVAAQSIKDLASKKSVCTARVLHHLWKRCFLV